MSSSATEYDEPATTVASFMRPFLHDGRYACYDNAACDVDDEDDESPLDSLSTIRGDDDDDDERLLSVDGYEGDGDSDEYGCGERDDDDGGEYATYGSDFSVEELHEFMLQQQQQSMLDYAYSLRRYSLLETIREETSDELRGDAASEQSDSCSGVWCWGDDFTDGAESVIYVEETPVAAELDDDDDDDDDDANGSDKNTEAESSDSTGSVTSVEMAPLCVVGPRRQSPGGHLEDPSEREGSWLDAEAEPDLQLTSGQDDAHRGNGWDSQNTSNVVSSCSRTSSTTVVSETSTMATVMSSTDQARAVFRAETLLSKSADDDSSTEVSDASPPSSLRLAPSSLKAMDSATVLSYLKSVLVSGDGNADVDLTYRALLQRHLDKSPSSDTDLLILFDNEEATNPLGAAVAQTPPRDSDASDFESPPESEFPSWSDAIDAYLMSLEVDQAAPSGGGATAAPLWRRQVVGSDAITDGPTPKSCLGSVIPGHDLPIANTASAAPPTHRSTESPPSCFRDGSPADFDGVEALERTAGDGAEEAAPVASCHEAATATLGRRHPAAASDDCKPLRLSGVKSAPDLLLGDGDDPKDVHGVAFYDGGDGKTQSVPCIASSSGDEEEERSGGADDGFGASKAYFGLGVSDLSCCQLDRGRFSRSLDSQFSRSFAGSSSGCASEEEEEDGDDSASNSVDEEEEEEERSCGSLSRFPRFTPPGALRSFRSFDTLHLAGQREEGALKRSSGSWMDGIEECSEREEKARPSSDNLSEDSGYCDAGLRSRSKANDRKMALLTETVDDGKVEPLVVDVFNVRIEDLGNGETRMQKLDIGESDDILEIGGTFAKMALDAEDSLRMDRFQNDKKIDHQVTIADTEDDAILDYRKQPEMSDKMTPFRTNQFRVQTDPKINAQDRESKPGLDAILETESYPGNSVQMALDSLGEDLFQSVAQTDQLISGQGIVEDDFVLETGGECSKMADDSEDGRLRRLLLSDSERRHRGHTLSLQGASTFGHSDEIGSTSVCALNEVALAAHDAAADASPVHENVLKADEEGVDLGCLPLYEHFEKLAKNSIADIPDGDAPNGNDRNHQQCMEDNADQRKMKGATSGSDASQLFHHHHQQSPIEISWEKRQKERGMGAPNGSNVNQHQNQRQVAEDSWDELQITSSPNGDQQQRQLEIVTDSWGNHKITNVTEVQQLMAEHSQDQQQVRDAPIDNNVNQHQNHQQTIEDSPDRKQITGAPSGDVEHQKRQQSWPLGEENDAVSPPERNSPDANAQCGSDHVAISCQDWGHQTRRTPSPLTLSEKPTEACVSAARDAEGSSGMSPPHITPHGDDDDLTPPLVPHFDEGVAAILGPEALHSTRAIASRILEGHGVTPVNLGQLSTPVGGAGVAPTPGKCSLINQTDGFIVEDNPESGGAAESALKIVSDDQEMDNVGDSATVDEASTIANDSTCNGSVKDLPKVTKIYAIITLVRRTSCSASVDDSRTLEDAVQRSGESANDSKGKPEIVGKTAGLVQSNDRRKDPTIVQPSDDFACRSNDKDDSAYRSEEIANNPDAMENPLLPGTISTDSASTIVSNLQVDSTLPTNISHRASPQSRDGVLTLVDKSRSGVDDPGEILASTKVEPLPTVGVFSTPPKTAEASGAARDRSLADRPTDSRSNIEKERLSSSVEKQLPIRDKKRVKAGGDRGGKEDRREEKRGEEDSFEKREEDCGEGALSRRALNSSAFTPAPQNTHELQPAAVVPLARAGKTSRKSSKVGLTRDDDVSKIDENTLSVPQQSIGSDDATALKLATTSTTASPSGGEVQKLSDRSLQSSATTIPSSDVAAGGAKRRGKKGDAAMSRVKQPGKIKRHLWWPLKIGKSSSSASAERTPTTQESRGSSGKSVEASPPSNRRPKDLDDEWDPDWIGTSIDVEPEVPPTYGDRMHPTNGNATSSYDGLGRQPEVPQTYDGGEIPTNGNANSTYDERVIAANGNVVPTYDSVDDQPGVTSTYDAEGTPIRDGTIPTYDGVFTSDFWGDRQRPLSPIPDALHDDGGAATAILIGNERPLSSPPPPPSSSYKTNGSATTLGKPPLPPTHRQQQQHHVHHQKVQVAPCRAKIINARQHFVVKGGPPARSSTADSDSDDCSAPRANVHEALEQFRQRAREGQERVAKTVLDLSQRIQERCSSDAIDPRRYVQSEAGSDGGGNSQRGGPHTDAITVSAVNGEHSDGDARRDENGDDFRCKNRFSDQNGDEEAASDALIDGRPWHNQHRRDEGSSSSASNASSPPTGGARSSFRRLSASSGHGGAASSSWRDSTQSIGYLETDIDTLHSREVIRVSDCDATAAAPLSPPATPYNGAGGSAHRHRPFKLKTQSMFNLTAADEVVATVAEAPEQQQRHHRLDCGGDDDVASRAKSMEFLLKDENKLSVLPPENQLRQTHGGDAAQRRPSEHELRVRRSLQKLDLPDWYTSSPISRMGSTEGFILRKDSCQPTTSVTRWADYRSRSSCNVDGNQARTPVSSTKSVVISKRVTTPDLRYVKSSRESLLQSPMSPSPSSKDASSGYFYCPGGAMSRWSSSRLSCTTTTSSRSTSPTGSLRLPFQRQPYLGWRSSERLAREATNCSVASSASSTPTHGGAASSFYRSAAERLSQGPGYYALRYGVYRTPGSETNLASPSQAVSRRGSNTSTTTAPPDAATMASPVAPLPPRYSPPDGSNHAGITVNVIEPNGYSSTAAAAEAGDDSGQMLVADLVREIDKLIHRNGYSDDHLAEVKEDDEPFKMAAVEEETKGDLASATDRQQTFVWMESSFVGVRPIAKPESPPNDYPAEARSPVPSPGGFAATEDTSTGRSPASPEKITSQAQVHPPPPALFQTPSLFRQESTDRRLSLNSTTLEEVLDSLLALPSSSQSPSPSGYRPSKWEAPEVESAALAKAYHEEETKPGAESNAAMAPEAIAAASEDASPVTVEADHSVPDPIGQSEACSSSGSDAGSTGSSSASSSGNSRADGEDDGNGRASGSSGSDLTTATTTVASGSSSYRLSGTTSTGGSPSGSGNSQSSSLSASTSASGSGKEVIPPPPDFTDQPPMRSQQSVPAPVGHERSKTLPREPTEAQLIINSKTHVVATADHASISGSAPIIGTSPTEIHPFASSEMHAATAYPTNTSEEPLKSRQIITSDTRAVGRASISNFFESPHHFVPSSIPPPPSIGHPPTEAYPIVSSNVHIATAVHASTSEVSGTYQPRNNSFASEEFSGMPPIMLCATPASSFDDAGSDIMEVEEQEQKQKQEEEQEQDVDRSLPDKYGSSSKHVATDVHASTSEVSSTCQPSNTTFESEEFSASPPIMLCATAASSIDDDDAGSDLMEVEKEEQDVGRPLPEPRRSDSFPPPPTPEQFRELQQLHQSQHQSFDSDVALPLSDSFSSSLGIPSSVQSSSSCEPAEPVLDAGECRFGVDVGACNDTGARQESFDEIPEDDDGRSMDVITLLEPDATLLKNDVSMFNNPQDTHFEGESVISESTTSHRGSLDTTREEDIMMPDRRSLQLDDTVIVRCSHVQCKKTAELRDARKTFKTCHNCYTYYCSRECRKDHWTRHRRVCMYGRIRSMCKQAIQCCRESSNVLVQLSKVARTGYITQGRGFVKIVFRNTDLAIRFLRQGWSQLEDGPMYVNWRDLIPQEMGDEVYRAVVDLCQRYEPETKFVLLVAIFITREVPVQSVPHWEREVIAKCARLSLSRFVGKDGHGLLNEDPNTLILTGPQQTRGADVVAARKAREICLVNIQEQLRERGVSLRHQFPDAYSRLCAYVDNDDPFPPLTIYPKDGRTGNTFMCVIMPNSGPQLNDWLKSKVK